MKASEILGMIEEACGTRLYETKKIQAQKTMEKKDSKVAESYLDLAKEVLNDAREKSKTRNTNELQSR